MGYSYVTLRLILITIMICMLLNHHRKMVKATTVNSNNDDGTAQLPTRGRAIRFPTSSRLISPQYARARQQFIPDFIVDDDDLFDLNKRQSDDYGHMRFGKREFDDYGHMRFGRSESGSD